MEQYFLKETYIQRRMTFRQFGWIRNTAPLLNDDRLSIQEEEVTLPNA